MKVVIETEGRRTGESHVIGGLMGGDAWERYWRVIIDGHAYPWVNAAERRYTTNADGDRVLVSRYTRLAESTRYKIGRDRVRRIIDAYGEQWKADERERINADRARRGLKTKASWRHDGPTPPWVGSSGWGLQRHTLTRFTMHE